MDTELESQQLKANELAKKEPGVAFNSKRRQGKLFAECNVCSSEVAVGQANHAESEFVKVAHYNLKAQVKCSH